MNLRFSIDSWAAWAPGLTDQSAWTDWFIAPRAVVGDDVPALPEMPAMMRRRLERLGRAALQVAYQAMQGAPPCPVVFASRYGDMRRSVELMKQLASEAAMSPTAFSMSVHNAFAALFSIARGDRSNYSAVSAGAETAECALVEAIALLGEGAAQVLVVYYDEPLPEPLTMFAPAHEFPRAWACRIARSRVAGIEMAHLSDSVARPAATRATDADAMPPDLALLHFLVGLQPAHARRIDGRCWLWTRT